MKFVENPQVAKVLHPGKLQVGHDLLYEPTVLC